MRKKYLIAYRDSEIIIYNIEDREIKISVEDASLFEMKKWGWQRGNQKKEVYYLVEKCGGWGMFLHRQIVNAKKGEIVDHINRDTTDCTRANLRIATSHESRLNTSANFNKVLDTPKGVSARFLNGKIRYRASITILGKQHYLGYFKSKSEASDAYEAKAKERDAIYREKGLIK